MEQELSGKTALITGASRGIGAATALAFASHGVRQMTLQYNSYRLGAEETAAAISRLGAKADLIQADLGDSGGIQSMVAAVEGRDYDILVNNAGSLVRRAKLPEYTEDLFDRVMNLNVKSAWEITRAVSPRMVTRGSGFVIFVSSIAARNGGGPGATIYAAAKAAISTITKGVAKELAPHGIRVNAVSPGTVDNYFHEQFSTREMLDAAAKMTPAGRLGTNEEIADAIVFLCSEGSRFIYGQTIEINGGMLMV